MISRLAAGALLAQFLVAALAFGQQAESFEFGRASGGAVTLTPKGATNQFSLSLGMSVGHGRQGNASVGGAIVPDRLWFFGTGQFGKFAPAAAPQLTSADLVKQLHVTGTVSTNNTFTFITSHTKDTP